MNKFKVTDPKGIFIDGKHHEKGAKVSISEGAILDAFLHFKQVAEVDDKSDDEADAKAKAKAEAKAEADAKAKAEADAKANK
jgi:hypothetical protein